MKESSRLFSPSLICSACASLILTLCADSADECVCLVRWKDIHNHKAVSSRKVLISFFPSSYWLFPHSQTVSHRFRVQHPKPVHTYSTFTIPTCLELLYYKLNDTEHTILHQLMPPLGLACPCIFSSYSSLVQKITQIQKGENKQVFLSSFTWEKLSPLRGWHCSSTRSTAPVIFPILSASWAKNRSSTGVPLDRTSHSVNELTISITQTGLFLSQFPAMALNR